MMQVNSLANMIFVEGRQFSQRVFIVSDNQGCTVTKGYRAEFYGIETEFYFL